MNLIVNSITVPKENVVVGIRAALMVDDVNGNVLVIQSEVTQLRIKLSDLVDFIAYQKAEADRSSGSNGEDVNE